jgi:HEAT repeat protein
MTARAKFEQQLAALDALRENASSPATLEALRRTLANRNNFLAGKAARLAAEFNLSALIPDLLSALHRFFADPVKTDPQCWAKMALAAGLSGLGYQESGPFLRGLRHVQMEPVWGGQEDTAAGLRGACAAALVECHDIGDHALLSHLLEVLVDPNTKVRIEAARAIGRLNRPEAGLLLRLRTLVGDPEPEALGACFAALLAVEGPSAIGFVSRFLDSGGEDAPEAALALGLMRDPEAVQVLLERWRRERRADFADTLLSALALSRQQPAIDFLLGLISADDGGAASAVGALAAAGLPSSFHPQIETAVERSGNPELRAAFSKGFGLQQGQAQQKF